MSPTGQMTTASGTESLDGWGHKDLCHPERMVECVTIRLLGRPSIQRPDGVDCRLRSRKSWALLAYLLLAEGTPTRSQLAGLLYAEAAHTVHREAHGLVADEIYLVSEHS